MTVQLSIAVRNARLNAIEAAVGTSAKLRILTGAQPATCAAAQSGTLLCEMPLPSDWMATASSGSVAMLGSWTASAVAAGTAAHFRLVDSAGTTCHMQGSVSITAAGGDLQLDNTAIGSAQIVAVTTFTVTDANP